MISVIILLEQEEFMEVFKADFYEEVESLVGSKQELHRICEGYNALALSEDNLQYANIGHQAFVALLAVGDLIALIDSD